MSKDRNPVNEARHYSVLERYRAVVPGSWMRFQESVRSSPPVTVWRNATRIHDPDFRAWFSEYERGTAEPRPWDPRVYRLSTTDADRVSPDNLLAYGAGLYHVQEESAAIPATVLSPAAGTRTLDMCAAPGNKTAQLAQMTGIDGLVIANDVSERRLQSGIPTWERLGLLNITASVYDGSSLPRIDGALHNVLVDVPCSGEGTCRRNPSALRPSTEQFRRHLYATQTRLLERSIDLCAAGGRILYCTCTFAPEENEIRIDELLRGPFGDKVCIEPIALPGFRLAPGIRR